MSVSPKPQARKMARRSRDRERRREDFLDAAEKVFARRGYHAASMEDIGEEAGYATGTVYRYFASKSELYQTLLENKARAHQAHMRACAEGGGSCRERVVALLRGELEFIRRHHDFLRLFVAEVAVAGGSPDCAIGEGCRRMRDDHRRAFRKLVDEGARTGEFAAPDPELVSVLLGSLGHLFFSEFIAPHPSGAAFERRLARLEVFLTDLVSKILHP